MLKEFAEVLAARVPRGRPVLVSSAIWPLARATRETPDRMAHAVVDVLLDHIGPEGHLIMPALVRGYRDGFCDLDQEPATTGVVPEVFRKRTDVRRTCSVYSSYAVAGPESEEFVFLKSDEVWGPRSHLEWLEPRDAHCLMIGTHPTHCVYLHRVEWLVANLLPYRYRKTLSGTAKHEGKNHQLSETLLVRVLDPEVQQDFTPLLPALVAGGMSIDKVAGVPIVSMSAADMRATVEPILRHDPLAVIANRKDFEGKKVPVNG